MPHSASVGRALSRALYSRLLPRRAWPDERLDRKTNGPSLTNDTSPGYKEEVVTVRARAACCCTEAPWAPKLTVVSR